MTLKKQNEITRAKMGKLGTREKIFAVVEVVVFTVSVVEAEAPDGVTVAGEKLHDPPEGNPEHAKVTSELNPPVGAIVTSIEPLLPAATVIDAGATARVKFGMEKVAVEG